MAWRSIGAFIGEDGTTYADVPDSTIDAIIRANLDASGAISYDEDWPGTFSLGNVHVALQGGYTSSMLDSPSVGRVTQEMNPGETIDYISQGYAIRFKDYNNYEYYMGIAADQSTGYYTSTAYVKFVDQDGTEVLHTMAPQCMCRPSGAGYMDYAPFQSWFVPTNYPWFYQTPKEPPEVGYDVHQDGTHTYANYIYVDDDTQQATVVTLEQLIKTAYLEPVEPRQWRVTLKGPSNNDAYTRGLLYNVLEETTPPDPPAPPDPEPGTGTDGSYSGKGHKGQVGGGTYSKLPTQTVTKGEKPSRDGMDIGFFTLYTLDDIELRKAAASMWSSTVWENLRKLYNSPIDIIISCYMLPFVPKSTDIAANATPIKCGNTTLMANGFIVNKRYASYDLGSITIDPSWKSFFDYSPNTSYKIYLPFVGEFDLSDDIIHTITNVDNDAAITGTGATLKLTYELDYLTGIISAILEVNGSVHYQFNGNAKIDFPVSMATYQNSINSFLSGLKTAGLLAAGFMALPALGPLGALLAGAGVTGIAGVAGALEGYKEKNTQTTSTNGQATGIAGALESKYPYITRTSRVIAPMDDMCDVLGYRVDQISTIGDVDGHDEAGGIICAEGVQLTGYVGTDEEKEEILKILQEGILL